MIGTGAVVGVMGAFIKKLYAAGQHQHRGTSDMGINRELLIMVPVSYSETLNSKIMGKTPKEYISYLISPKLGMVYAVCFVSIICIWIWWFPI